MRPVREILPLALLGVGVVAVAVVTVLVKAPRLPAMRPPAADPALLGPLILLLAGLITLAWARSWDAGAERRLGYIAGGALAGLAAVAALWVALAR
jgi:hypothetical protein